MGKKVSVAAQTATPLTTVDTVTKAIDLTGKAVKDVFAGKFGTVETVIRNKVGPDWRVTVKTSKVRGTATRTVTRRTTR